MALTQISKDGVKADLIDGTKIADDAINSEHYVDGSIDTAHIAADQITGALIADDAVNAEHIGDLTANLKWTDSQKAVFGAGDDLQLYHSSDQSYITNSTGNLRIDADHLRLRSNTGNEAFLSVSLNGGVELYYDNSKKFETTSYGVSVPNRMNIQTISIEDWDSTNETGALKCGTGNDLKIYHDGSNSYIRNSTGGLNISTSDGNPLQILGGENMAETLARFSDNGAVELYYDNVKHFQTTSAGIQVISPEGTSAAIELIADDGDDAGDNWEIRSNQDVNDLTFRNNTSGSLADILTLEKDGDLKLTGDLWCTADNKKVQVGAGADLQIYHDGTDTYFDNNVGNFYIRNDGNSTTENIRIQGKGGEEGIVVTANGGVDLYHDNVQKFSTRSNGFMSSGVGEVYICAGSTDASGAGILLDGDSNGDFAGADYASIVHNVNGDLILETRRPAASNGVIGFKPYDGSSNDYALILAHDACWSYHAFYPWTDDNRDLGYSGRRWDDIYATNSTIQTSDRNTKDNITDTDLGLPFINKLTPKSYKFKGKTRTHYGLIAQDVETVLSDISKPTSGFAGFIKADVPVDYYTQYDESIPEGKSIGDVKNAAHTTYGLRYSEFIAPLIKAVQELSTEVETLKTKVSALEAK